MRRLGLILLVSAILAPAALAARHAAGDGTVAGRNIAGSVVIVGHGAFWGTVATGPTNGGPAVQLIDPDPTDDTIAKVSNWDTKKTPLPFTTSYSGDNIRFQIVSDGRISLILRGSGISFSGVGGGKVKLDGAETAASTGSYQIGDAPWLPVPYLGTSVQFPAVP
jgi:hypothetical protein